MQLGDKNLAGEMWRGSRTWGWMVGFGNRVVSINSGGR